MTEQDRKQIKAVGVMESMSGCDLVSCQWYVNGKCASVDDFVNPETGEDMCYRNIVAVPREEYEARSKRNG